MSRTKFRRRVLRTKIYMFAFNLDGIVQGDICRAFTLIWLIFFCTCWAIWIGAQRAECYILLSSLNWILFTMDSYLYTIVLHGFERALQFAWFVNEYAISMDIFKYMFKRMLQALRPLGDKWDSKYQLLHLRIVMLVLRFGVLIGPLNIKHCTSGIGDEAQNVEWH